MKIIRLHFYKQKNKLLTIASTCEKAHCPKIYYIGDTYFCDRMHQNFLLQEPASNSWCKVKLMFIGQSMSNCNAFYLYTATSAGLLATLSYAHT